jgi:hypothetical protein
MASAFNAAQSEFSSDHALPGGMMRKRPSLVARAARRVTRFLIVLCIGVATTLAWQSYGDLARAMIAISYPQLGWLAPEAAPVTQTAPPDMAAGAAPPAPSADVQQLKELSLSLKELSLGLDAVRQSVDQLAAQVAAGQRQMAGDIAKLQAEISPPPQRAAAAPAAAPARKPVPPTPALPLSLIQPPPVR